MVRALLLLVALHATFNTSTTAVISWEQPPDPPGLTHTCLVRKYGAAYPASICWNDLAEGTQRVELPGAFDRRWYTPAWGDVYELHVNGEVVGTTTLGEVPSVYTTYLPAIQKAEPSAPPLVYVPVLRR